MQEAFATALLWVVFGGTHIALTTTRVRRRLVAWLGEGGFIVAYSIVAIVTFGALVRYVALHRGAGAHGAWLATIPPVRGALLVVAVFGFSLFVAGVLLYPRLPMAAFLHRAAPVRGIQQISRHPFFSGLAVWAAAHAMLAPSRVTFVFFAGLIVFVFFGGLHQDRRLTAELGEPYRSYVAATSFWPFVAVATKRQKLRWTEQPWLAYALGVASSVGLYQVHGHIFDHDGAYVVVTVAAGSVVALLNAKVRARRRGRS